MITELMPVIKAAAFAGTCLEKETAEWSFAWRVTHSPGVVLFFLFFLTSGLADHDVAVFALAAVVEALHLDVVGGLGLEVSDHVPVLHT